MSDAIVGTLEIGLEMNLADLYKQVREAKAEFDSLKGNVVGSMSEADKAVANAGLSYRQLERAAQRLRDQIDPLAPAQRDYARALAIADAQIKTNMISEHEHARALDMAEAKLDAATAAQRRNDIALQTSAQTQQRYSREVAQLKANIDPAWSALQRYEQQISLLKRAQAEGAITHGQYTAEVRKATAEYQRAGQGVTAANGAMRAGMQQLSFQFNDMATMWAMGARGTQIFASQAGQTFQAIQLMTGGTSKLAAFLGGPWGMALTTAAVVLTPFIAKLLEAKDATAQVEFASYKLGDAQSILGGVMDLTTGKINTQSSALHALARAQAVAGRVQAQARAAEARKAVVGLQDPEWILGGGMGGGFSIERKRPIEGQISSQLLNGAITSEQAIKKLERLREIGRITDETFLSAAQSIANLGVEAENIKVFGDLEKALDGDPAALSQFLKPNKKKPKGDKHAESLARDAQATAAQTQNLLALADAYLEADSSALKLEVTSRAVAAGIKKRADIEAYVAQQLHLEVAQRAADGAKAVAALREQTDARRALNDQIAAGRMTSAEATQALQNEAQLRPILAAQAIAEGDAKAKLTTIIQALRDEQARSNAEEMRSQDLQQSAQIRERIRMVDEEARMTGELGQARIAALKGLSGNALEDELARLDLQHRQALRTVEAQVEAEKLRAAGLHETAQATLDAALAANKLDDQNFINAEQERAIQRTNQQLREMLQLLQGIGGIGGALGGILDGLMTGNFSGLGNAGGLLNILMKSPDYTQQAELIGKKVGEVFGIGGPFAQTIGTLLQGAAVGTFAGSTITGNKGTGAQIGGALGGAMGGMLASSFMSSAGGVAMQAAVSNALGGAIGSALGSAVPVIGTILGGLAGNLIGGLFGKSVKWGRADISNTTDDPRLRGNKGSFEDAAGGAASAVIDGLNSIAEQLGGITGEFAQLSIGIRDGNWRVNTSGKSLKTKNGAVDFGEDGEAAIAYAIQQAIKAGAISGMRESTLRLLQTGKDFQTQLQKAMTFEGVFDALKAETDPLGYALDQLGTKFASLRKIFVEAGATAEEMAQLDQLQKIEEQKIRAAAAAEAAAKRARQLELEAQLLALQGKATQALAKGREAELSQLEASLQAIQKQIHAEEDAAVRRQLQIQLLEAQGNVAAARELQRAETLRTTLDENKALQQRIWLSQDLSDAYGRESQALQSTVDKMKQMGDSLREFRASLFTVDGGTLGYNQALAKLMEVGGLAAAGDEDAIAKLSETSREYLNAAKNSAGSLADYQRAVSLVTRYADQAIAWTDNEGSVAEQQLEQMKAQVGSLISIDEHVVSVHDALEALTTFLAGNPPDAPAPTAPTSSSAQSQHQKRVEDLLKQMHEQMGRLFGPLASLDLRFGRWDRGNYMASADDEEVGA